MGSNLDLLVKAGDFFVKVIRFNQKVNAFLVLLITESEFNLVILCRHLQ